MQDLQQSARASLAAEGLRRSGRLAMRVYGTSMLAAIWPGDEVVFETCAAADVEAGDVLLYRRDDRLVVHRVIQICRVRDEFGFLSRGDNQRGCDLPVRGEEVLGRAVFVRRAGRAPRVILQVRSPAARLVSWVTSRSTLSCELVLRLYRVCEWLRSSFSSQRPHREGVIGARS